MKPKIVLTGGGSGGHLLPAKTIAQALQKESYVIHYLGRNHELERNVLSNVVDSFHPIPTGKFRRYFLIKSIFLNVIDIYKVMYSCLLAGTILYNIKKTITRETVDKNKKIIVFSTGGYVSLPVVIVAYILRQPIFIHEQTATAGLANQIAARLAKKVFISIPSSAQYYPLKKIVISGYPIRPELSVKNSIPKILPKTIKEKLAKIIKGEKPFILFSGGSNGSLLINQIVNKHLTAITKKYNVVHQTGSQFINSFLPLTNANYYPLAFTTGEIWNILLKSCNLLIGRSGAGIVHECVYLKKSVIYIPLAIAQKNEQYLNAKYATDKIPTAIINERDAKKITSEELLTKINTVLKEPKELDSNDSHKEEAIKIILTEINKL